MTISIMISELFEACEMQTSTDFQALRVRSASGADAVYEDWVLTSDGVPNIEDMIEEYMADMKYALRTFMGAYSVDDGADVELNILNDNVDEQAIRSKVRSYLKYRLLSWWYSYRDSGLSTIYEKKAQEMLSAIFVYCTPAVGTLRSRYF